MTVVARFIVRLFWERGARMPGRLVKWAMLRAGQDYIRSLRIPFAGAVADGMQNWPREGGTK